MWYNLGAMVSTIQENKLKQLNSRALDISDNEILTFEHIPNGNSYQIKYKTRSKTSISNFWKTYQYYEHTTTPPLNQFDIPYPPHIHTFTKEEIAGFNALGVGRTPRHTEIFESGELQTPENNSGGITVGIWYYILTGDIIKYTGPDDIWTLYYTDDYWGNADDSFDDLNLIQTFKNNDEYLHDSLKYNNKQLYLVRENDISSLIWIIPEKPDLFIYNIRTGPYFQTQSYNPEYKYQTYISDISRQIWYQFLTPDRPQVLNEDETLSQTPGGIPGNSDDFFNFTWFINHSPIASLYESGDLNLTGSVYFDCKQAGEMKLKTGKLLNSVSSIRNPNNTEIEGLPQLIDQTFEITLTTLDTTNNKSYWTGKDRSNEYNNQEITSIELYYDDVLKITYGAGIYDLIIGSSFLGVYIDTPNGSLLTHGNVGPEGLNQELLVKYPKPSADILAKLKIFHNSGTEIIDINFSDLTDYINPAEEPTTQYNLVYFPHTNTYRWLRNWFLQTGGTIQPPDDDQLPPVIGPGYGGTVGTFSAKYTTQQISSRRTLNPAVGLEKIAQTTEYAVFNGETEFNNNVLLEQINNDIALYFTIYSNKNKKDPTTDEDNFKDKANIELVNDNNKWIFNRDCLNANLETASTNFQHQGVDKLIIKNTEIESTVDLKVSKIIFGDNTELSSFTDISTTHPDYVEFSKNLKLPNGDIISSYFDGNYNNLTNQPTLFDGNYNNLTNQPTLFDGNYNNLTNQPTIPNAYTDSDVENVLANSAGNGIAFHPLSKVFNCLITQYTDANVQSVLSTSAGTNITWNTSTNQFDASGGGTTYTDADARTACFPLTQTNTGLTGTNQIELFANALWYNTMDGNNRFYFTNNGGTFIYAPNTLYSSVMTLIATTAVFKCEIDKVTSYKNLHVGTGGITMPTLFLDGANNQSVSSRIIFGDSGSTVYKNGVVIYYDSIDNKLKFSGDRDADNQIDTPNAITIKRDNNYVGILNDNPTVPLEVGGAITASGTIKSSSGFTFPDDTVQTTASTLPSYLFTPSIWKYRLNSITNVNHSYSGSTNNYPAIFSGSGAVLLSLNPAIQINATNQLKILTAGYYQVHMSFRFRNNQGGNSARASIQNFIEINGSFAVDRVCTTYMRNTNNLDCACSNQGCIVEYFNVNDLIKIGFMRIGNSSGNCELFGNNSSITFQRIA